MNNIDLYDIIRNPVITEKATLISENGQVIFDVSKGCLLYTSEAADDLL